MFPNDENGDVLRLVHESGDDLSKPRGIDFTVVLPDKTAVQAFADRFHDLGYQVAAKKSNTVPELPWDVVVTKFMTPTHAGITQFELELRAVSEPLGGRNDGWGCFEQ